MIGFGGAAAPYAIYVHENVSARHAPPTQAKFLEQPVMEARATFGEALAAQMKLGL